MRYTHGMETNDEPQLPPSPRGLIAEFWDFLLHEKVWWMTPIVVVLVAMVAFILASDTGVILPFIYTL